MHRPSLKGLRVPVTTSKTRTEARDGSRFLQAGPLLALLALTACDVPPQANLRTLFRDASGAAMESRLAPPGMDRPTPNLASVPPVAQRPDLSQRTGVTSRLEQDRAASATALPPRVEPATAQAPAPGSPAIPGSAPPPPRLAPAAAVPWVAPRGSAVPVEPSGQPLAPGEVPAAPPPDLLAPPPPLLAPAPASR